MKIIAKISLAFIALLAAGIITLSVVIAAWDANPYRPLIIQKISERTGYAVALNGAVKFSLSWRGVKISAQDAAIANPLWASRPMLATIGKIEMTVDVMPLLAHKIELRDLTVDHADILLESDAAGRGNWERDSVPATSAAITAAPPVVSQKNRLAIDDVTITDSRIAWRGDAEKINSLHTQSLKWIKTPSGALLDFQGDSDGDPVTARLTINRADARTKTPFSFDADATYALFHLTAQGKADSGNKKAVIDTYTLSAGTTTITGRFDVAWDGARPSITGTVRSDKMTVDDFIAKNADTATETPSPAATPTSSPPLLFGAKKAPLSVLKKINAVIDLAIGECVVGQDSLQQLMAKLTLVDGNLTVSPINALVAQAPLEGRLQLDAAQSPARLTVGIRGEGIDLGDIQKLGGMTPFLSGKAGTIIQLTGVGDSAHDVAASLGGVITITAEKGEIIGGALSGISSALATVLAPQGDDFAINCFAARFLVKDGVLTDNGILLDSAASTVAGKGAIDLGAESINLTLRAKTKLIDLGGLVPPLTIHGTLQNPHYDFDAVGAVKNAVNSLLNGQMPMTSTEVPDVQTAPVGQNACVYTLAHPQAVDAARIMPADAAGKIKQNIQKWRGALRGLFGQ